MNKLYNKKIEEIGKTKVWLVDGEYVGKNINEDFVEYDHHLRIKTIPQNEIWIEDILSPKERRFILVHELHERSLMKKGLSYHKAHRSATKVEDFCRHNPSKTEKIIQKELKNNE